MGLKIEPGIKYAAVMTWHRKRLEAGEPGAEEFEQVRINSRHGACASLNEALATNTSYAQALIARLTTFRLRGFFK